MSHYNEGDDVQWKWGAGVARGRVREIYTREVTREISGTCVTRKADESCPAYLIVQDDGQEVLKSHSEVTSADG